MATYVVLYKSIFNLKTYPVSLAIARALDGMIRLHPQTPCHFTWHTSTQVSQTLRSSLIAASTYAEGHWNLHPSDFRNTLTYAHTTSCLLPTCDISLGPLTLAVSEVEGFWILSCSVHLCLRNMGIEKNHNSKTISLWEENWAHKRNPNMESQNQWRIR